MLEDISIEIIKKCPNLCLHCSSSSTMNSHTILPFSLLKSVINGLSYLGAKRLSLSGGEPFFHPEIFKIVHFATTVNLDVNIYSCGVIEKKGKLSCISIEDFEHLKRNGINQVMFNLQSTKEHIYNKITNTSNHFPFVIESIKNAVKVGICSEIHFVPMKINQNEINDIIKFGEATGIKQVSFLKLVPHGRAVQNLNKIILSKEEDLLIQETLHRAKLNGAKIRIGIPLSKPSDCNTCHAVSEKLYIRYDGFVFGCEAFKYIDFNSEKDNLIVPNNIYEMSIEKIVANSSHLKKSQELVSRYQFIGCASESCPVQKHLKSERKTNVQHK